MKEHNKAKFDLILREKFAEGVSTLIKWRKFFKIFPSKVSTHIAENDF